MCENLMPGNVCPMASRVKRLDRWYSSLYQREESQKRGIPWI
ncbi:hypothetical protein Ga0080574_TMP1736 [Salipiger abyssi]|uniref:Uncharacterized protein n=1 Tax=Salipiger abyssi TaxID=1250539 RepID=A0A1P8URP2_9RHOB|nr:hypothetical protein Ga0080574_TMP1736 [Salipiger abyssi]